jgi:hypothetical protein
MSTASRQLSLGPMALPSVSGAPETVRKSVNPTGLASRALAKAGIQSKQAAADMGISPSLFSRQFNEASEEHPSLKRMGSLPREFWREFALLLCEDLGLSVNGPDVERHALADVLQSCATYVRVMSR